MNQCSVLTWEAIEILCHETRCQGASQVALGASQVALVVKNLPANTGRCKRQRFDPWVEKNSLEEGMATDSSIIFFLPSIYIYSMFLFFF